MYRSRSRIDIRKVISLLKKWYLLIIVVVLFTIVYVVIPAILRNNHNLNEWVESMKYELTSSIYGDPITKTDAYIMSTYYYPNSKSLGINAIGMVLLMNRNTMRDMRRYKMKLVAFDGNNHSVSVIPKLLEESYGNCPYINMVATTTVLPGMTRLEIHDGLTRMEIPFKMARSKAPAPVIICLAPQFVAEQWQLFVAHAHIARHFGGHLHLYITSMIDSYFDLVQEYERLGYVTIDFWMRLKFANSSADSVEPNLHSELRNQAGAQSDCLLQYKEAASFITFVDVDDIFIPRGYNSYFEEFSALYNDHPGILTFQYTKREMMFYNKPSINDMNVEEIFGHTWFVNEEDYGKVMAKPDNLNSMWVHQSWNIPNDKHFISRSNYLIHFQKPVDADGTDPVPYRMSNFELMDNMQLNISVLTPIQQELKRVLNTTTIQEIAERLPKKVYYFSIIYRCYYEKFYKKPKKDSCPNGEKCLIPQRSDMNCIHSDADFKSGPEMFPITYHYHINPRWNRTEGCQP